MKYALAVVIEAASKDEAEEFVSDQLAQPHPWEGPCSGHFVSAAFDIAEVEEYDAQTVTAAINVGFRQSLADQVLTEEALGEQLGEAAECEQTAHRDDDRNGAA